MQLCKGDIEKHDKVSAAHRPNATKSALNYITLLNVQPEDFFHHVVAILHSPAYHAENAGALRMDWPRIPLPASAETLRRSADLGRQLAALLDPETPVPGVTAGVPRPELVRLGVVRRVGGGGLQDSDMALTAGWGHVQREGAVMPGQGRTVRRAYAPEEQAALAAGAESLGLTAAQATALLGAETCDVYLNGTAFWANVPEAVWAYKLGGYQVVKKWLSYREQSVLGRPLRLEEVQEVTAMVRRIAAILLLGPALDASFAAVRREARPADAPAAMVPAEAGG